MFTSHLKSLSVKHSLSVLPDRVRVCFTSHLKSLSVKHSLSVLHRESMFTSHLKSLSVNQAFCFPQGVHVHWSTEVM